MVIHAEKTKIMIVMTQQWTHRDKNDISICINGNKLQVVENVIISLRGMPIYTQHDCQKTHTSVQDKKYLPCKKENILQ